MNVTEAEHNRAEARSQSRAPVVLQILPRLVTGGVERGTVDIAQALARAGWGAVVVSEGGPMVRELERAGAKHIALPVASKNPHVMWKNVDRLAAVISETGADIVHARSRAPAWSAEAAAKRAGRHFLTTFHGTYNLGPFALKRGYNAVMARGERVIAISQFIADHIHRIYGVGPERVRVIHRGVDFERFDPARVSPERMIQLARAWRLPDDMPVIMLPGRLTRWKGQSILIEAIARLARRDVRCLLVGSDQGRTGYHEELENLVKRKKLTDIVHIVGDCLDMPAAYMLSDVVVSASTDPEAFGRVIVEAQAMGRAVVAADHGGARETLIEGETGLLTPPGDPDALARALERALSLTSAQREAIAARAMEHVRVNFSREHMCAQTLALYAEILGRAAPATEAPVSP